jgi:hypothetical protein
MSRKNITVLVALLCLLTLLNVSALVLNVSAPARAAVAGMSYEQLVADPDFTRAVHSIVLKCKVNVDLARLNC